MNTHTTARKDPHGRLPVTQALRADVRALCLGGAADTPETERRAVEQWAEDRSLQLRTAWRLWRSYAKPSHRTPFYLLTVVGSVL